nr:2TM domain-containing protein [Leucobacter weissii]
MREAARKRIEGKRAFWRLLFVFVIIAIILNVVWLASGYREYYWPVWPMLGFAIALLFTALNAFGPGSKPISDEAIDREVRRINGEG